MEATKLLCPDCGSEIWDGPVGSKLAKCWNHHESTGGTLAFDTMGDDDDETYSIVRFYFNAERETIATGLTLEEAQEHCNDPDTSSSTTTSEEGVARTEEYGPWFDGYESE